MAEVVNNTWNPNELLSYEDLMSVSDSYNSTPANIKEIPSYEEVVSMFGDIDLKSDDFSTTQEVNEINKTKNNVKNAVSYSLLSKKYNYKFEIGDDFNVSYYPLSSKDKVFKNLTNNVLVEETPLNKLDSSKEGIVWKVEKAGYDTISGTSKWNPVDNVTTINPGVVIKPSSYNYVIQVQNYDITYAEAKTNAGSSTVRLGQNKITPNMARVKLIVDSVDVYEAESCEENNFMPVFRFALNRSAASCVYTIEGDDYSYSASTSFRVNYTDYNQGEEAVYATEVTRNPKPLNYNVVFVNNNLEAPIEDDQLIFYYQKDSWVVDCFPLELGEKEYSFTNTARNLTLLVSDSLHNGLEFIKRYEITPSETPTVINYGEIVSSIQFYIKPIDQNGDSITSFPGMITYDSRLIRLVDFTQEWDSGYNYMVITATSKIPNASVPFTSTTFNVTADAGWGCSLSSITMNMGESREVTFVNLRESVEPSQSGGTSEDYIGDKYSGITNPTFSAVTPSFSGATEISGTTPDLNDEYSATTPSFSGTTETSGGTSGDYVGDKFSGMTPEYSAVTPSFSGATETSGGTNGGYIGDKFSGMTSGSTDFDDIVTGGTKFTGDTTDWSGSFSGATDFDDNILSPGLDLEGKEYDDGN